MDDKDPLSASAPTVTVPAMIDDYQQRRETLEAQARELAQLQHDVLAAAEREGSAIVADARAKVASILVDARRDLLNLITRVETIAGTKDDLRGLAALPPADRPADAAIRPPVAAAAVHESLRRARREIGRLMQDAKPEIERLSHAAPILGPAAPLPDESAGARLDDADRALQGSLLRNPMAIESETRPPGPVFQPASRPDVSASPLVFGPEPWGRSRLMWVVTVVVVGVVMIAAAIWWMRRSPSRPEGGAPPPVASAPSRPNGAPSEAASPSNPPPAVQPTAALALVIEARRSVWLRTTIDGRADDGRIVDAGAQSRITADREVSIRAGDAGAISVSVNGGPPQVLGRDGEVVMRRFTAGEQPTSGESSAPNSAPNPQPSATAAFTTPPTMEAGPSAPPSPSGGSSGPEQTPTRDSPTGRAELTTAAQRWLDAYVRQDAAAMQSVAARDTKVSDQRSAAERLPPSAEHARGTLEDVSFQFVGETSIMTARLIERGDVAGQASQYKSWISLMWIREKGQWRLMDVQILSEDKLRTRR
jgi:uncharacterized protein DUF4115